MSDIEVAYTPALDYAINNAPQDVTDVQERTDLAGQSVNLWKKIDYQPVEDMPGFTTVYDRTVEVINAQNKNPMEAVQSLNRYLLGEATTIATTRMLYQHPDRIDHALSSADLANRLQSNSTEFQAFRIIAAYTLLRQLTNPQTPDEFSARRETMERIRRIETHALFDLQEQIRKQLPDKTGIATALDLVTAEASVDSELKDFIQQTVQKARKKFNDTANAGKIPAIRFMTAVYNDVDRYCREHNPPFNNPLLNLTLGDVTGHGMPEDVVEAMGFNPLSPKGLSIQARAATIIRNMSEAGRKTDPNRYDAPALGWKGLRNKFIDYATSFGLYDIEGTQSPDQILAAESIIGAGGAESLRKAFTAAKEYLVISKGINNPEAYFPTPAFRFVANQARKAGLVVNEIPSKPENNFLPDLSELDKYFDGNKNCKVFVFTPINNPGSKITTDKYIRELLPILKKHDVLMVNDYAYLGTGDMEMNRELGNALKQYRNRIDVFSMSKIFGRPGLRAGCAITPMAEFVNEGEHKGKPYTFVSVGQNIQLAEPYPMQAEAIAIWELVDQNDRRYLAEYYIKQQTRLKSWMERINTQRVKKGKKALFKLEDPSKPVFGDAALYIYAPLNIDDINAETSDSEQIDAFKVIEETGLVGTPGGAFYPGYDDGYMRFALAVERLPDPNDLPTEA